MGSCPGATSVAVDRPRAGSSDRAAEHGDDSSRRGTVVTGVRAAARRRRGTGLELNSRVRRPAPAAPADRGPALGRAGAGADRAGDRRPRRALPRTPATSWPWSAARCATRCSAGQHNDLDFTTSARPDADRGAAQGLGRRDLGHGPRLRHHRLPQGRVAGRDHDVPLGGLRPVLAQAGRRLRRHPRRRPGPARLHRQRDGGDGCPTARSRTRTAAWSTSPTGCCARRAVPRTPSPTTRCG